MGCCFSRELSGDNDSEKAGLLQKPLEEKEPENKISKTFSALFGALQSEGLERVELGTSQAAAGANVWTRVFAGSGHKQVRRSRPQCSFSASSVCESLTRYGSLDEADRNSGAIAIEQSGGSVCAPPCVSTDRTQGFSAQVCSEGDECILHVLGPSDQVVQEGAPVSNHLRHYPVICKNSVVNVRISHSHESNALGMFGRELKGEYPICVDHKRYWNSRESEFYSICVVDPGSVDVEDEPCAYVCGAAAAEESLPAVTSEGTCRGAWPSDNTAQGPAELQAPQKELSPCGLLGPSEVKEVSNEKTKLSSELLTDSDPRYKVNTGDRQAEPLRANTYTRFPKDCPERSALCNVGRILESNTNIDTDSLECVCATPEGESCSSALGSPVGDPPVSVINGTCSVERNDDAGAVDASVDQSLNSEKAGEKYCVKPLKDNSCSNLDVSRSDRSLPLSSGRCTTSGSFGNVCLPVDANFPEAAPRRLDDPRPEHLRLVVMARQQGGDCSLGTGSKGEVSVRPENGLSYQDEDELSVSKGEGHGKRALERRRLSQVDLCADTGSRKVQAQVCDFTQAMQEAHVEGVFQRTDTQGLIGSQEVPLDGRSPSGPTCVQSHFTSSAFIFTCAKEEEIEVCLTPETEDELKSSGSDPHRLEEESLQVNHREPSKNDSENVTLNSRRVFDWETNTLKGKAGPGQDLASVSSSITKNADFEIKQMEQSDGTHTVNDCRHEELHLLPSVSSGVQVARAGKALSLRGSGTAGREPVCACAGEVSDALGPGAAVGREEEEGLPWEKDSSVSSSRDCGGRRGTSRRAQHFQQRNATATVTGTPLHDEVGFLGSSRVNGGEMEFHDTLAGYSCLAGVDHAQVDRQIAAPQSVPHTVPVIPDDSKEIIVPSGEDNVLFLSEDTVNRCESPSEAGLQGFPEELDSGYLNELSCYLMGGLASHIFSEGLADGCRHPVGCLWANAVVQDALGDGQTLVGDLHSQPQDLEIASFWMGKPPHQLPMAEAGVIWGWQNGSAQLVSMLLLLCCDMLIFNFDCF